MFTEAGNICSRPPGLTITQITSIDKHKKCHPNNSTIQLFWIEKARIITGRNEVVAKVMFLLVSVILLTVGVGSASVHAGISPPPWEQTPPGSRHPLGVDTPREQTPPWEQTPNGKQTPAYGQ